MPCWRFGSLPWRQWCYLDNEEETAGATLTMKKNAANSDRRTERPRERRAAERSEQRETRLARRRVADRASLS